MFRKLRPILLILGLAVGIGSIIGARQLTNGNSAEASGKNDAPRSQGGPVVLGTVDTDPQPVAYGLPPILQSGTVKEVFVKDGFEITADMIQKGKNALYAFDDTIQRADLKRAETAVAYAKTKVNEAKELANQHAENIKIAEQTVETAKRKVDLTHQYYKLVEQNAERLYRIEKIAEADWPERKKSDPNLYKANVDYDTAVNELNITKAKLNQMKAVDPQVKVKEAEAAVEQAEAERAKAQSAVDLCVVRAKVPGVVEQVTIGPGTTLGVGTRNPALWLIPTGPRVVRAEVEAEFAHSVGPDRIGRQVTIFDHSDPKLTYSGTVLRISNTFLLKRNSTDNFLGNDTRVIEVVVEVTDPAPANKPPLRVGQRVRVNLGQ